MNNLRLGLVALAAPLLLASCNKEQNDTPTPAAQEEAADATSSGRCPSYARKPLPGFPGVMCGCMDNVPNLAQNKKKYLDAGASIDFLASAMMETNDMRTGGYNTKVNYPYGDRKNGDAFNAGALKMNWYTIRSSRNPDFPNGGGGPKRYNDAHQLDKNPKMDVRAYKYAVKHYGSVNAFLGMHRDPTLYRNNPSHYDIRRFQAAWKWTRDQIAKYPGSRTNGVRFSVEIPAK